MPRANSIRKLVLCVFLLVLLWVAAPGSAAQAPRAVAATNPESVVFGATPVFTINHSGAIDHLPAVAYNPQTDEFLTVWHTAYAVGLGTRDVWGQFVKKSGQLVGSPFIIASETAMENIQPAVAYDLFYNRFLVVWVRSPNADGSSGDIYGRFITATGPSKTDQMFPICDWLSSQWGPKIAYTTWPIPNPSFMVVWWTEGSSGGPDYVSGRKINVDGTMPYVAFGISPSETSDSRHLPDIAATPLPLTNRYLVVYEKMDMGPNSEVRGRYVDVTGTPQGDEFAISESGEGFGLQQNAAVDSCGLDFAVVYQRSVNQFDVYLQFIDDYSGKLGSIKVLASSTALEEDPDVACGGDLDRYLVTWTQQFSGEQGFGIEGRLAFANADLGPWRVLIRPASPLGRYHSAIASDFPLSGGHYGFLVAAEAAQTDGLADIYGVTVLTSGTWIPVIRK
jgi:hypothetical protein